MIQQLPLVPATPNYRVGTSLDGVSYVFDVRWNGRAAAWYVDILDEEADPICVGLKVVLGAALGARSADPRRPAGLLMASDLSGEGREATFDDLGSRVVVYFYPFADLAEAA